MGNFNLIWTVAFASKRSHYRHSAVDVSGPGTVLIRAAFKVGAGGRILEVDAAPEDGLLTRVAEPDLFL